MIWEKLRKPHYHKEPVEYIYATGIFDLKEYEKLYENQNDLSHQVWNDFQTTHKFKKINFFNDLKNIDLNKTITCLWFFKDRGDKNAGNDIELGDKNKRIIVFRTNTFFITNCPYIKILSRKKYFPRRQCLQIEMSVNTYNNIIEKLK